MFNSLRRQWAYTGFARASNFRKFRPIITKGSRKIPSCQSSLFKCGDSQYISAQNAAM